MIALYRFQFGTMYIEYEGEVLYKLRSVTDRAEITQENIACRSAFSNKVYTQAMEFLAGKRKTFDIEYQITGTAFQKRVWSALQNIPYGQTSTYKQIAAETGNEKACRAVGMANNKNPLFLIIPCHRVTGSNGSLTGYAGGLEMKKYLLDTEKKFK